MKENTKINYIKRLSKSPNEGLSTREINERIENGFVNFNTGIKTKSVKRIIFERTFTFLNVMNVIFMSLVIIAGFIDGVGSLDTFKNITFMGVILSNTFIGTIQEIRSKKIIDKLSLISAPSSTAVRNGEKVNISIDEIVLDDILYLKIGEQITADSTVIDGEIEVNESLLTGEADAVTKKVGDELLSGSFVVSGSAYTRVMSVGRENYAQKITDGAKYLKKTNSSIVKYLDKIIKIVCFLLIPLGLLLFSKQYFLTGDLLSDAVFSTVASLIAMIPEGLILLTSMVFVLSVIRLSKHRTLVQELYCTETLARTDVLCLDKTGTITEGTMQVEHVIPLENSDINCVDEVLTAIINSLNDENPTFNSIKEYYREKTAELIPENTVAFSSARKWSGVKFKDENTYVLGAGELILGGKFLLYKHICEEYSKKGNRVLVLAQSRENFIDKKLPENLSAMGIIVLSDKIRDDAEETLKYFSEQGIDIKVISGDNALTVSNTASKVGIKNSEKYIDLSTYDGEDYSKICEEHTVFGRVMPEQKLMLIKALKANGHTVAMTGDGVNDVVALKEADCSIAMASGSDAARTVSDLVLLDSKFASVPLAFKEGRRSINNLQRSASLYLNKTIYAVILSVMFLLVASSYPFEPVQLTLIGAVTIGVPSFILALEPNRAIVKGDFLFNILKISMPVSVCIAVNIFVLTILEYIQILTQAEFSTLAVIITAFCAFVLLYKLSLPFNKLRLILFVSMLILFAVGVVFLKSLFSIVSFTYEMFIITILLMIFSAFFIKLVSKIKAMNLLKFRITLR